MIKAVNISAVMKYYDDLYVDIKQPETVLKHLIARKEILVDMDSKYISFPELLKTIDLEKEWDEECLIKFMLKFQSSMMKNLRYYP